MLQHYDRRDFIKCLTLAGWTLAISEQSHAIQPTSPLRIAPFRFDVTPPIGHGCCGGWIKPVEVIDDPLEAIGMVIVGAGDPIVLCAVDWTGILNSAHVRWREALAAAAGTTAERVAVHCVHQHNAPFACLEAQQLLDAQGDLPPMIDVPYFNRCLMNGQAAVKAAMGQLKTVERIGYGQAKVKEVAGNRRLDRDANGKVLSMRGSACKVQRLREMPEGLIDPYLKTIAFYADNQAITSLHYYACHPMSYYGDGRVTSDFVGLARRQRQSADPNNTRIYFTGCAGNVAAGKYNDGSHDARIALTEKVHVAMCDADKAIKQEDIRTVTWRTVTLIPPPRSTPSLSQLQEQMQNKQGAVASRSRPSYEIALKQRSPEMPIVLSALHLGPVVLLHLPGECFVEYQLRAQSLAPNQFVAVAAYGDGGPWYIPVKEEYANGGYEVSVAFCDPAIDDLLTTAMKSLLG